MAEAIGIEVVKELVKQLYAVSKKAYMCKDIAKNLATTIDDLQPTIQEIMDSSGESSQHRQDQLRMFFDNLEECRMLTEKVLKCKRWNFVRQINYVKKMEDLDRKIYRFSQGIVPLHTLADVRHLRGAVDRMSKNVHRNEQVTKARIFAYGDNSTARLDQIEKFLDILIDRITSLKINIFNLSEGKGKVKKMLFKSTDEERLIGISGMSGSGKTTLAREIERDEEVRGNFGNKVLFLTVSQSPNLEKLRSLILEFLTDNEAGSGAILPVSIGQTRKLVILDDVWTRESLEQLMFENFPGTTTLVVSRSKLAGPRMTYDVELLDEHDAMTLLCLSAFDQKSVPSGLSRSLVKQVVDECKGLPLSLKVIGASLKGRPEKYWQGAVNRLSRGEPADINHETIVFAQIEASLEILDKKSRECFLDLGAFPEDKKIPLGVIINMWVELHDMDEETAFSILMDLADKNLLTLVKDPRFGALYTGYHDVFVTQHDVLRDVALLLSSFGKVNSRKRLSMPQRALTLPREWERSNDEPYNARVVSIHTGEMNEMDWFDMELPKTEVLIINFSSDNYVLPPFIAKMGRLKALLVINNGLFHVRLQDFSSFTNLAKLRSLWLQMVYVPYSTITLKHLQKLSLIFCKSVNQKALDMNLIFPNLSDITIDHCEDLVELPSTISGITSLNSISITNCPSIGELPNNMSKLMALELLRLYACPELKSLPEEICELPNLKYIDISQCVNLSCLPEEVGKLSRLEKIDMRACPLLSIPSSAVKLTSLCHVICDKENLCMWEKIENAVPGLRVEATEDCLD
ncbi:putative disease resistance protein At5g47280 [Capsella rubella]|uniref:putative disease resistance protein At5g47280 n=1 Tax=Capsella rubella TaxID=81985 RepID=UPI000CD4FFBA|nr:putative disease resistance protein At5g47280 [Capsella rubella]